MRKQYAYSQYIWERPEWPRFTWDAERLLEPFCSQTEGHVGRYEKRVGILSEVFGMYDVVLADTVTELFIEFLQGSGRIAFRRLDFIITPRSLYEKGFASIGSGLPILVASSVARPPSRPRYE